MITCEDWRDAPPDVVASLFDAECARWYDSLGWDYRPSCRLLDAARRKGRLSGLLARDDRGDVVGWTYFLLNQETLQIGNLVGKDAAAVRRLLRAVAHAPEARKARRLWCFLYPNLPAVESTLVRIRFAIERHAYLQRPLCGEPAVAASRRPSENREYVLRGWAPQLIPNLARLFARAYQGMPEARCFAPDGHGEQWTTYVGHLVQTPACGRFEGALSLLAETPAGELAGAVLVTTLADRTAHIAQMAVAVEHRKQGLGDRLVRSVCERAREARYDRVTLLVAESNDPARRLYRRLGFESAARFLFAERDARAGTGP